MHERKFGAFQVEMNFTSTNEVASKIALSRRTTLVPSQKNEGGRTNK